MTTLYIDTETRSGTDVRMGVYRYVEDPDFKVQVTAWAVDDGPVQVAEGVPAEVEHLLHDPSVKKITHNAQFDRVVLGAHLGTGYPEPGAWAQDTLARARCFGYPGKLKDLAKALGAEDKDEAGTRLIKKFAVPPFADPAEHPEDWHAYMEYCRQDVATLRDIDHRLPRLPEPEVQVYVATERMNDRGIAVDEEATRLLKEQYEATCESNLERMRELTGLENPNSQQQLTRWLSERLGSPVRSIAKEAVAALLEGDLQAEVREVLLLKQYNGLSTAKKFTAILDRVCQDGRLHGETQYMGAANTGRFSSRGTQLQNLSHDDQSVDRWEAMMVDVRLGSVLSADELRSMIRPLFRPVQSPVFVDDDYSQIEARLLAFLSGEETVLEHFRNGRDLYTETAKEMGPSFTRKEGKVATLGLGYAGGANALKNFGGEAMVPEGEDVDTYLWGMVRAWRESHPHTVQLWDTLMEDFIRGGGWFESPGPGVRALRLPSGRRLYYRDVRKGWDARYDRPEYTCLDPKVPGKRRKVTKNTLSNNLVQATARDLMAGALVRADAGGLRPVVLVHDEMICETEDADRVQVAMETLPSWAEGLPLPAVPETMRRWVKA